jgi:predicted RNA binding protein YcfA (HicA-like mRNA interferase family)
MPRKIRKLIKDLEMAGFINRGGKGSHRNFIHPTGVVLSYRANSEMMQNLIKKN